MKDLLQHAKIANSRSLYYTSSPPTTSFNICPITTIHLPYRHHDITTEAEAKYGVAQFEKTVIPQLEAMTGIKFDMDRLKEYLGYSRQMEQEIAKIFALAKNDPCPIDGLHQALYYIGPINTYWRGTPEGGGRCRRSAAHLR